MLSRHHKHRWPEVCTRDPKELDASNTQLKYDQDLHWSADCDCVKSECKWYARLYRLDVDLANIREVRNVRDILKCAVGSKSSAEVQIDGALA